MKILVEFTAVLDVKDLKSGSAVDLADGATIADLLHVLKVKKEHQRYIAAFVNNGKKRPADKLKDGDRVMLSLPVGGG